MQKLTLLLLLSSIAPMLADNSAAHSAALAKESRLQSQVAQLEAEYARLPEEISRKARELALAEAEVGKHQALAQSGSKPSEAQQHAQAKAASLKAQIEAAHKRLKELGSRIARAKREHALAQADVGKYETLKQAPAPIRTKRDARPAAVSAQRVVPVEFEEEDVEEVF